MGKLKVISLFSGCGGLDLGFERAGFDIPVANEFDPKICPTFKINHPKTKLIEGDIRKIKEEDFPNEVDVYKDIRDLLNNYKESNEELFIIGGASIYRLFLPISNKLYLTEIEAECNSADAYFPTFNKEDYERTILMENEDNGVHYKHVLYRK